MRKVHKSAGFISLTPFIVSQIGFASQKGIYRLIFEVHHLSSLYHFRPYDWGNMLLRYIFGEAPSPID